MGFRQAQEVEGPARGVKDTTQRYIVSGHSATKYSQENQKATPPGRT